MLHNLGFIKCAKSQTWVHAAGSERSNVINKELGTQFPEHASAVSDTLRTPKGDLIWIGSIVPGHKLVKAKTKLVTPTETKERTEFYDTKVIEKALKDRKETLKKTSWFQGTAKNVI